MLNSSDHLRRAIVDLLWQQWAALGVSGHLAPQGNAVIDPEALVLMSTAFARHDARLFDEMADWLQQNGIWINVLRLTRLQREHALGDDTILGALAEHMAQDSSHTKWKVLAKAPPAVAEPVSLFPHLPPPNRTDEIFRRWGWLRPPVERRGLSRPPRPNQPASFLLKMRALFGRQSRAEVFAWLLTHDSGHPAQIARETAYFRGSVQNVLNELELSGHVFATREGREKHFVAPPDAWRFLLTWTQGPDGAFPQWVPWAVLFTLIRRFHDLVNSPTFAGYSGDLQAIELNRRLAPLVARLNSEGYPAQGFADPVAGRSAEQLMPRFQHLVAELTG
ncbi:MAG: hypothetical protein FJ399_00900 [Verrucomicrobia bacterium]|nr:hypothetical protein [Verrucomicrobiota bacterium]